MAEPVPPSNASRIIKQNSNTRYNLIGGNPEKSSDLPANLSNYPHRPPSESSNLSIEEETAIARLAQLFAMRGTVGGVLRLLLKIVKASGAEGAKAIDADSGDYRLLLLAAIAEVRAQRPGKS